MIVPYAALPYRYARKLIRAQREYSEAQCDMARGSPHLIWVEPQRRPVSRETRALVWEESTGACSYCGSSLDEVTFTLDHIIPRCEGGGNERENLTVACADCNRSKSAKPLSEWQGEAQ
jgi:5-methylcytosine-specific restriction endonuclease McrA